MRGIIPKYINIVHLNFYDVFIASLILHDFEDIDNKNNDLEFSQ